MMVELVKKPSAIKILILMTLKTIVLKYDWDREYEREAKYTVKMSSDNDGKKNLPKLNTSMFRNVTKYALFYYFIIVIKISGELFTIVAVREPSALVIDLGH